MAQAHPAESKLWKVGLAATFLGYLFFSAIGDGKLLGMLAMISFGLFVIIGVGAVVAEVLLNHAYWAESRQHDSK